jgi:NTP pyrophosphatase (non-canonical NTP hydrolase)
MTDPTFQHIAVISKILQETMELSTWINKAKGLLIEHKKLS